MRPHAVNMFPSASELEPAKRTFADGHAVLVRTGCGAPPGKRVSCDELQTLDFDPRGGRTGPFYESFLEAQARGRFVTEFADRIAPGEPFDPVLDELLSTERHVTRMTSLLEPGEMVADLHFTKEEGRPPLRIHTTIRGRVVAGIGAAPGVFLAVGLIAGGLIAGRSWSRRRPYLAATVLYLASCLAIEVLVGG